MIKLVDTIKIFFEKKTKNEETELAPEGVCPNCWGKQEWEGHFYKQMKTENITPGSDTYTNFIKEFVTKHIDGISLKEDTYICTSCSTKYEV